MTYGKSHISKPPPNGGTRYLSRSRPLLGQDPQDILPSLSLTRASLICYQSKNFVPGTFTEETSSPKTTPPLDPELSRGMLCPSLPSLAQAWKSGNPRKVCQTFWVWQLKADTALGTSLPSDHGGTWGSCLGSQKLVTAIFSQTWRLLGLHFHLLG